jgi:type IV secretion system protein VirB10
MPNGRSVSIEGMPGVDLSGYAGVSNRVDEHWFRLLTGVVLSAVLNASAAELENSNGDIYLKEGGRSFSQAGEKIVQRQLDVQPTTYCPPGWNFNILVQKDMILKPY